MLTLEDVQSQVKVTEAEVKNYFDTHKNVYQAGNSEKRKITYAVLPTAKIDGAQITDADVQNYYTGHHDEFAVPEQVKVSHILIKTIGPDKTRSEAGRACEGESRGYPEAAQGGCGLFRPSQEKF